MGPKRSLDWPFSYTFASFFGTPKPVFMNRSTWPHLEIRRQTPKDGFLRLSASQPRLYGPPTGCHPAMEATSYKLQIGDSAPAFKDLPGVDGKSYGLNTFKDRKVLVVFWHCNHCPYAQAYEGRLNQVCKDYTPKGVGFVAINSNDAVEYPEDSFDNMKARARTNGLVFPYVYDEPQEVALAYGAVCTPHVLVFDPARRLQYQGRVDGLKDDPTKGNGADLRNALDDLLAGRPVRTPTTRAFGCSVKWKESTLTQLRR